MLTTPVLFARARGVVCPTGEHRCFYCCASCDEEFPTSQYVKSSFTGISGVRAPGSQFVCRGCVECLQESVTLTTHDGKVRTGQKVRGYSWIITESQSVPCTKADREFIATTCLNPPAAPYVICISDGGKKHFLYRGVVNYSRDVVTATLEEESITYRPHELNQRIELIVPLIAATGKPALEEGLSRRQRMIIVQEHGETVLNAWLSVSQQPLSRLAIWLAPGKDGCVERLGVPA